MVKTTFADMQNKVVCNIYIKQEILIEILKIAVVLNHIVINFLILTGTTASSIFSLIFNVI